MDVFEIEVTESQFADLNERFPPSTASAATGLRAEELLRLHFSASHAGARFETASPGADMKIVIDGDAFEIEVKGTSKSEIGWTQLKVSSQTSHDRLINGLPLYRVVGVYERNPRVYVMRCGEDFDLAPEARWTVKRRRRRGDA